MKYLKTFESLRIEEEQDIVNIMNILKDEGLDVRFGSSFGGGFEIRVGNTGYGELLWNRHRILDHQKFMKHMQDVISRLDQLTYTFDQMEIHYSASIKLPQGRNDNHLMSSLLKLEKDKNPAIKYEYLIGMDIYNVGLIENLESINEIKIDLVRLYFNNK